MKNSIRRIMSRALTNLDGWKTSRKIVVIESDDWGSIRMPDSTTFAHFHKLGYPVAQRPFEKFDTLADSADLEMLFDTLKTIRNAQGQNPVITANTVVANPDFEKIKNSAFQEYFREPFTSTLKRYYPEDDTFVTWQKGFDQKLFFPQFHAREHYNIARWMKLLQQHDADALLAFEHNMVGIPSKLNPELGNQLQIALGVDSEDDIIQQKRILIDGLQLFQQIFGFRAQSFIAPVYTWNSALESTLAEQGIKYIQGGKIQKSPDVTTGKIGNIKHRLGERNRFKQTYLVRNVFFEPATNQAKDWVGECFKDVEASFFFKRPAIISTHRLNFVGRLDDTNRERGNAMLQELLLKIVSKYPETEFMTSVELGNLISKSE